MADAPQDPPVQEEAPEGYVSLEDVKTKFVPREYFEKEIKRRTAALKKPEALLGDAEFRKRALATWSDELFEDEEFAQQARERLNIKADAPTPQGPTAEDLAKYKSKWERDYDEKRIKPLETRLTEYDTERKALRREKLFSQILSAASKLDIRRDLLEPPDDGDAPPIVGMVEQFFDWEEQQRNWYRRDGESGFAPSASGAPYKTVSEFLTDYVKDPRRAWMVEDKRQRGAGLEKPSAKGADATASKPVKDWTTKEKAEYLKSHSPEEFTKLFSKRS